VTTASGSDVIEVVDTGKQELTPRMKTIVTINSIGRKLLFLTAWSYVKNNDSMVNKQQSV